MVSLQAHTELVAITPNRIFHLLGIASKNLPSVQGSLKQGGLK
jgi:hypothetical protein